METLCLRNADKRYIVSFRNRILILTYDYNIAMKYMNFVKFAEAHRLSRRAPPWQFLV